MKSIRDRLIEKFNFDPHTGLITYRLDSWRKNNKGTVAGFVVGGKTGGYRQIRFDGRYYMAHRMMWLYVNGEWPCSFIDHVNGNRIDNRIENLRICCTQQNAFNAKRSKHNTSGYKGVALHNARGGWMVRVRARGKQHRVLGFRTKEMAYEFACLMRNVLHGEFAKH